MGAVGQHIVYNCEIGRRWLGQVLIDTINVQYTLYGGAFARRGLVIGLGRLRLKDERAYIDMRP